MKYVRMKRNATGIIEFNQADATKLKKYLAKVDKAIREIRDISSSNLSRDVPRDFTNRFGNHLVEADNNLRELWNLINDALGLF